ncbi:uncharacterized protein KY384_002876 [Bacidia gigantensis]|uniref:uncharacterized protein n=1 Tax=Bacidia gigantensis TaxID=2732470 RepID=UPI001D05B411|nr:uncharacterized protein KY384_002876 [Bacidia gigantensis]KAG8532391.1 hypothetical protein KY384_002876 [Bacidia gigantensis]
MYPPFFPDRLHCWYPVGNTPAVDFFRTFGQNTAEAVKVLSLGCGDPRNILYSLHCERGFGKKANKIAKRWLIALVATDICRKYEIYACDHEPAILGTIALSRDATCLTDSFSARNIMLFASLMSPPLDMDGTVSGKDLESTWRMFYNTQISQADLKTMKLLADMLVSASSSNANWASSPYGKFIKFASLTTLPTLREFWLDYSRTAELTSLEQSVFDQAIRAQIKRHVKETMGDDTSMNSFRSAGPPRMNTAIVIKLGLDKYAETGVVGGNKPDMQRLGGAGHINPTFVFSSWGKRKYTAHFATNPLDGFHLAEVFDSADSPDKLRKRAVQTARMQFHTWCKSFAQTALKEARVQLTLHCGDALHFCYQYRSTVSSDDLSFLTRLWKVPTLNQDDAAGHKSPMLFDVIDTSNLIDHLGLLNVLPATVPLLRRTPLSTLYTEALTMECANPSEFLESTLCRSPGTMAVLLGIVPCEYFVVDTFCSPRCEQLIGQLTARGEIHYYRLQTSWKYQSKGWPRYSSIEPDRTITQRRLVGIDPKELAGFLAFYFELFFVAHKINWTTRTLECPRYVERFKDQSKPRYMRNYRGLYSSFSFVSLLVIFMNNVSTDWSMCIDLFIKRVRTLVDQSILVNDFQEFLLVLAAHGIRSATIDSELKVHQNQTFPQILRSHIPSVGDDIGSIVNVVHMVVRIPRSTLLPIIRAEAKTIGNPGLRAQIHNAKNGKVHEFALLRWCLGSLNFSSDDQPFCSIEEDTAGWSGESDLIVTFPAPASALTSQPANDIRISLRLHNQTVLPFLKDKLGPDYFLGNYPFSDRSHVGVLETSSTGDNLTEAYRIPIIRCGRPIDAAGPSALISDRNSIEFLTLRDNIVSGSTHSKALSRGAEVSVSQLSPFDMVIRIGSEEPRTLSYPFPINGASVKTRVARKSSWIELIVKIASPGTMSGFNIDPFPTVMVKGQPYCWTSPRVNIEQQPKMSLNGHLSWTGQHMHPSFGQAGEAAIRNHGSQSPLLPALLRLKATICLLLSHFIGFSPMKTIRKKFRGFELHVSKSCRVWIYVNAVRHEASTASIFLDAWVIEESHQRLDFPAEDFLVVEIKQDEFELWRRLLLNIAERCRKGWTHKANCEYITTGSMPLASPSILCSCGRGMAPKDFPNHPRLRRLKKKATRIALCPIFTTSHCCDISS